MTTEEMHLQRAFEKLSNTQPGNGAAGVEYQYGDAYQVLVRMGLRPQIRRKYRGAK